LRPGLDGSDAGALVRLAQGTNPARDPRRSSLVGNPIPNQSRVAAPEWSLAGRWSTLVLSTGLGCQQSMRTVPGKAVLFGLMSLVSSPY
jgi:hypothetical protein